MRNLENSTIAIQKSGRLTQSTIDWLNENVGTDLPSSESPFDAKRELSDTKTGITLLGYSNGDISKAVVCGRSDLAVVGSDKYLERTDGLSIIGRLGIGVCEMVYAEFPDRATQQVSIATSYPRQAANYAQTMIWNTLDPGRWSGYTIDYWSGGVESIARRDGYTGVVDVVESGNSLMVNGLEVVDRLYRCEAVLIDAIPRNMPVNEYDIPRQLQPSYLTYDFLDVMQVEEIGR